MSTTRTGGGVAQRHAACECPREHTAGCRGEGCRCPRAHTAACEHVEVDGKARCRCTWAFTASTTRGGRRYQSTGSGYSSRRAAVTAREAALADLRRAPLAVRRTDTLGAWLDSWLERKTTGANALRPTSAREYRRHVEIIRPVIGGERLRDVTPDTLDALERALNRATPGKLASHKQTFAVLQSALRDAVRRGALLDDPTRRREAVRAPKRRRAMMQPEDFARLLAWVDAHGERWGSVLWFAAATGMRRGEIAGLRWVDVDLDAGRLVVAQSAVQVDREVHVGRVKTAAGEDRIVMLDARTIEALRGVQRQQAADAGAWGSDYGNDAALVFTNEDGSPLMPEQLTRALPRLIRRFNDDLRIARLDAVADADELARLTRSHGVGARRLAEIRADETLVGDPLVAVSFHSLRHLHASVLLASGRGLAAVQRRLGHSSIAVSSDLYGHLVESAARDDAEAAAALIPRRSATVS